MAAFLLMGIVLTNGYKGIVITDITAPLKERHISTIEEAVQENYTLVTPNPKKQVYLNSIVSTIRTTYSGTQAANLTDTQIATRFFDKQLGNFDFSQLSKIILLYGWLEREGINTRMSEFEVNLRETLIHGTSALNEGRVALLRAVTGMMETWSGREIAILINGTGYEFLKCNKTILVDTRAELPIKKAQLSRLAKFYTFGRANSTRVTLSIGSDTIIAVPIGVVVTGSQWDRGIIPNRMSRIISSGIYHKLKETERSAKLRYNTRLDPKSNEPSPLQLSSNILTLFVIYFSLLLLSFLWLNAEWLSNAYFRVKNSEVNIWQVFPQFPGFPTFSSRIIRRNMLKLVTLCVWPSKPSLKFNFWHSKVPNTNTR